MAFLHLTPRKRIFQHKFAKRQNSVAEAYQEFKGCKLDDTTVRAIEKITRGQDKNPAWVAFREGCVTSSRAKRVFTKTSSLLKNPKARADAILKEILGEDDFQSDAMKWGHESEPVALARYKKRMYRGHPQFTMRNCGLFMSKEVPLLGASPEALCYCKCHKSPLGKWIVEVKSPYANRHKDPLAAAIEDGYCVFDENRQLEVNRKHKVYFQIQTQLGVTKLTKCDLVIYTTKGICVVPVTFDPLFFAELKDRFSVFIEKYLFPKLYEQAQILM